MLFHFLIEFFALLFLQFDLNCSFNSTIVQQQQMPFLALLLSPSFSPKSSPPPPIRGRGKITTIWPIQIDDEPLKSGINSEDCEEEEEEEEENGNGRMEVDKNVKEADEWTISGETEPKTSKTIGPSNLKLPWGDGKRTTTKKGIEENIASGMHRIEEMIGVGRHISAANFGKCFAECSQLCSNSKPLYSPPTCPPCFGTTIRPKNGGKIITTTEPFYYEYEAPPDITQFGRCNVTVIVDQAQRIVIDLLFYAAAAWVPFWAFLCIAVNINCRQFGHHRLLDFYQELGFIVLFPFMGIFVLKPQLELLCLITTMVLLFCLIFILVIGFLQAYFASSLIKGTSLKDGHLPVAVNYVWPLVLASIPVGVSLWMLRPQIASNRLFCANPFRSILGIFRAHCLLWFLMLIRNQLSITACKQSRPAVDREQLYWARKSVKGTPILLCWFLLTFYTQMFAVDMQFLWLCLLFVIQSAILGPLLFLLHTHNHQKVNNTIFDRTQMGLYRPCPLRRQPVQQIGPPIPPPAQPQTDLPPTIETVQPQPQTTVVLPQISSSKPASSRPSSTPINPLSIFNPPSAQPQSILKRTQIWKEKAKSGGGGGGDENREKNGQNKGEEVEQGGGMGGGDANAQQFYEWLTDSDERNLRESERVLWPMGSNRSKQPI